MSEQFNELERHKNEKPSLLGIVMDAEKQFVKIRNNPRIIGALIIITLIFVIGTVMQMSYADPSTLIDDELAGIIEPGQEHIAYMLALFGSGIAALFMPTIIILFSTFVYWIVSKIVKSHVSFKQLFSMNTYILFINAIGVFINGLFVASTGRDSGFILTNLGSYVQGDSMFGSILSNIELFSIWALILTALGLQIVARFSKKAAWTVTIGLFLIGIVFSMVGTALGMLAGTL